VCDAIRVYMSPAELERAARFGMRYAIVLSILSACVPARPFERGAWDLGVWTAGGHTVHGSGTSDTTVWNAGFRAGKVLTSEHGPGILRGSLEYAADVIPVYLLFFRGHVSYAAGLDPLVLKWNFSSGSGFAPYLELGAGILFSGDDIPPGTSRVNFMPQAAVGVQVFTSSRRAVTVAATYLHISNAGLASPNPGINTVQVLIGYQWFR
jgi:hypothetical protein